MKCIFILYLLLSMFSVNAQENKLEGKMHYIEPSVDPSGTMEVISLPPPDYKGAIHLTDKFSPGKIHLKNGIANVELRFNFRDKIIEASRDNKYYSIPFNLVNEVVLSDSSLYRIEYETVKHILYEDEQVKLSKVFSLSIKKPTYDPRLNIGHPDNRYLINHEYLLQISKKKISIG